MPSSFSGFRLYKLDDRWRLTLPAGLESYIKWYDPQGIHECLAVPGLGGIVLFPPEALEEHRGMMARLATDHPRPGDIGSAGYELARVGTLTWAVTISKGRLLLPQEARELGMLPAEADAMVALVAFRGALEIWRPEDLRAHILGSVKKWDELRARGLVGH